MQHLSLKYGTKSTDTDSLSYDEMVVLAAGWDDFQELDPGDIVWAKLTGLSLFFPRCVAYAFNSCVTLTPESSCTF